MTQPTIRIAPTTPTRRFAIVAAFSLALAGAGSLAAQQSTINLGYLDSAESRSGTLDRSKTSESYWFYMRQPGMGVNATVRTLDGEILDEALLYDANGAVKASSRGRLGAQMGARGLSKGWHRLSLRTTQARFRYDMTIEPIRPGEPSDVGNSIAKAYDLGVIYANGKAYPNTVGPRDAIDVYRLEVRFPINHLELSLLQSRRGGATLDLVRQVNNQAQIIQRETATGGNSPLITQRLQPGVYFARVMAPFGSSNGAAGTSYKIYARNRQVAHDAGGDRQRPAILLQLPAVVRETITPQLDVWDAYRFQVPAGAGPIEISAQGARDDFAIYLMRGGSIIAGDTGLGSTSKLIRRNLGPGSYDLAVLARGTNDQPNAYSVTIRYQQSAPPRTNPAPSTNPTPRPIGRVAYRGFLFNDHSANTTISPRTIRVGQSFRITSSTMRFSGSGTALQVILEPVNRRAGSFGVGNLVLTNVRVNGNVLTVAGPDQAVYANQEYRVIVTTYTNRRPDSYASPNGIFLRVNP